MAREKWAEAHATGDYGEVLKRKERAEQPARRSQFCSGPRPLLCRWRFSGGVQTLVDLANGLAKALAVLDDCKTQEAFSFRTESSTGAHGDSAFIQKLHGEFDGAHFLPLLRYF